ncbi:MAG: succinate dehydrogenase, hydrophobic membrane anchor protein [Gammaproteobacteria bacterium]|nr:succinate dehydrogenase, hydrophobic membrane anchor protein [Gammaproteobacteria bacterium]
MVTNVSSFGRSGLYDWIIQRLTAVVLASYTFFLLGIFILNPDLDYEQWHGIFSSFGMRFYTLLAMLSVCAHAWVGMWTISTDYLTDDMLGSKAVAVRFVFQVVCALVFLAYLVWAIQILWGIS